MAVSAERLTPAEQLLLALLFAPSRGRRADPVFGRTILTKLVFLLWKNPVTGSILADEMRFEPYDFGPYSEWVDVALSELGSRGLVSQEPGKATKIALTREGTREAHTFFDALSTEQRAVVEDVKENFGTLSTATLLERIYAAYPEYATESKWRRER